MHTCMNIYLHSRIYTCIHACNLHACMHVDIHTYVYAYTHTHTYKTRHTCTYPYIYTHHLYAYILPCSQSSVICLISSAVSFLISFFLISFCLCVLFSFYSCSRFSRFPLVLALTLVGLRARSLALASLSRTHALSFWRILSCACPLSCHGCLFMCIHSSTCNNRLICSNSSSYSRFRNSSHRLTCSSRYVLTHKQKIHAIYIKQQVSNYVYMYTYIYI